MAGAVGIVFGLCVLSFTLGAALMYVLVRRREDADSREPAPSKAPDERTWVEKPAAVVPVDDEYDSRPIHRNPVMGLPQRESALASLAKPVLADEPERSAGLAAVAKREQVVELTPVVEFEPVTKAEQVSKAEQITKSGQVTKSAPVTKSEPAVEPGQLAAPETVGAARYDRDGDLAPPMGNFEAPESTVAPSTDSPETVAKPADLTKPATRANLTKPVELAKPAQHAEPVERAELAERAAPANPAEPAEPETEALAEAIVEPPAEEPEPAPQPVVQTALPQPASPQPAEHTTWVEREDFRQRYLRTFEEVRRKAGSN